MAQDKVNKTAHFGAFRRVLSPAAVGLALFGVFVLSCGDASVVSPQNPAYQTQAQTIDLVPEFSVNGAEAMPETVYFSELGLSIAEIRLEPLATTSEQSEQSSIIYSTRNAIRLDFDVAQGEEVIFGEPLELPHTGRYLISVRLEPVARVEQSPGTVHEVNIPSFRVEGFVATGGVPTRTERGRLDESSDGSPTPMPFEEDEAGQDEKSNEGSVQKGLEKDDGNWTPFHYDSRQSVFISLNEVKISDDSEFLSFEFDMNEWAESLAMPLQDAVQGDNSERSNSDHSSVDVTTRLEDDGYGAESLLNSARVSSLNQRR